MPDAVVCRDCANHPMFPYVPDWDGRPGEVPERPIRGTLTRRIELRTRAPGGALNALADGEASWCRLDCEATQYEVCDWCGTNIWSLGDPRDIFVIEWPSSYEHDDDDNDDDNDDVHFEDTDADDVVGVTLPVQHEARAECDDCESPLPYGTDSCPVCGGSSVRQVEAWTSGTEPPSEPEPEPERASLARSGWTLR